MHTFAGQWFGQLRGDSDGTIILNLEVIGQHLSGRVLVAESTPNPRAFSLWITPFHDAPEVTITGITDHLYNPQTGGMDPIRKSPEAIRELGYPDRATAILRLAEDGKSLEATWNSTLPTAGTARLESWVAPPESEGEENILFWAGFRDMVAQLDRDSWVFRGQPAPWSLRTCFHRRGRWDLIRYAAQDVDAIHTTFIADTGYWLKQADPFQYASLLSSAQHHGYPTPLLDWTRSPYIAAYFAVRQAVDGASPRIWAFNAQAWLEIVPPNDLLQVSDPRPLLSILTPKPFKNPRAVAQQALTTFSNIDYIERYVAFMTRGKPRVLRSFNLVPEERETILADLEWMGITESLLFPGLEGSFRTLARRRFPK